jgi:hypothetical protein
MFNGSPSFMRNLWNIVDFIIVVFSVRVIHFYSI